MCSGCGWTTGVHMTEFPTYGAGAHVTGLLGVSRGGQLTEGTDIFGALEANVASGLALEAPYHGRCGRGGVRDVNGVETGAGGSHNHFQSSGQSNASRAHCRSSSSVNSRPTSLSRSSVPPVMFSGGKGVRSPRGKGICSSGQLGKWVDCSVGGGHGVSGQGSSSWARGMCYSRESPHFIFSFLFRQLYYA